MTAIELERYDEHQLRDHDGRWADTVAGLGEDVYTYDDLEKIYGEVYDEQSTPLGITPVVFMNGDFGLFEEVDDEHRKVLFDGIDADDARKLADDVEWAATADVPEDVTPDPLNGFVEYRKSVAGTIVGIDDVGDVAFLVPQHGDPKHLGDYDRFDSSREDALKLSEALNDMADRHDEVLDDEPEADGLERSGRFDDATLALLLALHELDGGIARAWDPAKHPRGPGGKFRSTVDRLKDAIEQHRSGKGDGHPFDGFDREQLRKAAKARGIPLGRGEDRESIAGKLLGHLGGPGTKRPAGAAKGRKALAVPPARMKFVVKNPEAPIPQQVDEGHLTWRKGPPEGWDADRIAKHDRALFHYMEESNGVAPWDLRGGTASPEDARLIADVMAESRIPQDIVVWRGIREPQHQFGEALQGDLTGQTFTDPSFASTSAYRKVAERYADGQVLVEAHVPAGTGAVTLGFDDAEILLDRNLRHKVINDTGPGTSPRVVKTTVVPADDPVREYRSRQYYSAVTVNGEPITENARTRSGNVTPHSSMDERGSRAANLWAEAPVAAAIARQLREHRTGGTVDFGGQDLPLDPLIADLDHAVSQGRLTDDTELWRGILMDPADIERLFPVGAVFSDPSFAASSTSQSQAEVMLGWRKRESTNGFARSYLMRIQAPAGLHVSPGADPVYEVVLGRDTRMRVHSIDPPERPGFPSVITVEVLE